MADLSTLQDLVKKFRALRIKKRTGATFLEIARFPHRETVWSNILAFYLDPNREHDLHELLLQSVFEAMGHQPARLLAHMSNVTVETEVLTLKGNRIDLVVTANNFVLGIENKVTASLYNDLADYGTTLDGYAGGHVPVYKVVLSRYGVANRNDFVNITYAQLVKAIRQNLGSYTDYADARYLLFLLDFLKTIEKHHNPSHLMENPELLRFLRENASTVEQLVAQHQAVRQQLVLLLDRADERLVSQIYAANGLASQLLARGAQLTGAGSGKQHGRIVWEGKQLLKFAVSAGEAVAFCQVGIIEKYQLRGHFWANSSQAEGKLENGGVEERLFTLDNSADDVADWVHSQLEKMGESLMQMGDATPVIIPG